MPCRSRAHREELSLVSRACSVILVHLDVLSEISDVSSAPGLGLRSGPSQQGKTGTTAALALFSLSISVDCDDVAAPRRTPTRPDVPRRARRVTSHRAASRRVALRGVAARLVTRPPLEMSMESEERPTALDLI